MMADGSLEGFCDDVRRLVSACVSVERWLRADHVPNIPPQDGSTLPPTLAGGAPRPPCSHTLLGDQFPETHRICELACDLRRNCDRFLEDLRIDTGADRQRDARQPTVLVVDDVADTRELLTVILGQAGFAVATAANGLEGLLAAHKMRPSLILMDVQMPILDGIEATRLLKATEATRNIPVIAHTARPGSCHFPPGVLFAYVLPKPVIPDVLLALTQRFVGNGDIDRSPVRGLDQRIEEHPDVQEQMKSKTV